MFSLRSLNYWAKHYLTTSNTKTVTGLKGRVWLVFQGTVLIKTAEELMNFSKGEENLMDAQVKAIAGTGANVIVTGGKVADIALHYANKYNIMLVR